MSGGTEVATERGLGIQWWHVVAAGTCAWALFLATTGVEWLLGDHLRDAITTLALVAWPLIPVAIFLDLRSIRGRAAWEPATKSWLFGALLPIANVPVGVAYCLRRRYAVGSRLPPADWRYGVYAGLLVWVGVMAADGVAGYVGADLGVLDPVLTGLLIVAWLGFPLAVYFDAVRFDSYPDQQPRIRGLVLVAAVPVLNVLLVGGYACVRWWERRKLDPDAEPTLPESGGAGSTGRGALSPWYRRAAGVFVVYFVVVVAAGSWLPLESDLGWNLLGLVLWPPFGLAFVACVHFDLRDLRRAGVPWGETRYLYYLSVVIPAAAFWYLLRRITKVQRVRSKGLLDDGAGGGGGAGRDGGGGATTDVDAATQAPDETEEPDRPDADVAGGFEWGGGSRG